MSIEIDSQKNIDTLILNNDSIKIIGKEELMKSYKDLVRKRIIETDSFKNNYWRLPNKLDFGSYFNLDFTRLNINSSIASIESIKFWVISLLVKYEASTVANNFSFFTTCLNRSNCFSSEKINHFYHLMFNSTVIKNNNKYMMALTALNYIYFSNIHIDSEYIKIMHKVKATFYKKLNNKQLPQSKSILNFSYLLEHFYNDNFNVTNQDVSKREHLRAVYYPILIWWKLTSIIPMRIGEFCHIEKNGLIRKNNKFYIRFQRIKGDRRIDTFEIDDKTYNLIKEYINLTKKYKETKYLLSYDALIKLDPTSSRLHQSNSKEYFNRANFYNLLISFYNEIIGEYYNTHIPIYERLKPNDTRHIAIMSLMMQGLSPLEIANMAGHSTIERQYNYTFHPEFWVDNEVFKLQNKLKHAEGSLLSEFQDMPAYIITKAFKSPTSDYRGELKIGYCSDAEIRCESTNSCLLCSHWRIDREEYVDKKNMILEEIYNNRQNILKSVHFIKNSFTQITNNKTDETIPTTLSNHYYPTLEDIRGEIYNLTKLTQIINEGSDSN